MHKMITATAASVLPLLPMMGVLAAPAADPGRGLEEIVVTATRRSESIQDVPISMTAMTAQELGRTGRTRFLDIAFSAPNVTMLSFGGSTQFTNVSIRGIQERASVYVDDVLIGHRSGYNASFIDVDRIEVLRGPQGTLFGRNSIAGAINTITSQPDEDFSVLTDLTVGTYDLRQARGAVSGPLVDEKLFASLSAVYRERSGYDRIRSKGWRGNSEYSMGARVKLRFVPTDSFAATLSAEAGYDNPRPYYFDAFRDATATATAAQQDGDFFDRVVDAGPQRNKSPRRVYSTSLRGEYSFDGGMTLTSITAGRWSDGDNQYDVDFSPADGRFVHQPTHYQQFSQELRLSSASDARLTWLLGAFYFHDRLEGVTNIHVGPDFRYAPPRTVRELFEAGELSVSSFDTFNRQWPSVDSKAVFGSATYAATDALSVTAGLRYTTEDLSLAVKSDSTPAGFANRPFERFSKTEDNLSPTLSVNYKFTPDLLAYGTVSRGWQSGGFNTAPTIVIGGREFKPEKATNYEVGLKSTLWDRRLVANAAVFYMDYANLQRGQFFLVGSNLVQTTTNAAEASVRGAELDLTARAAPGLDLSLRLGYQDAQYDKYPNAPVQTETGGSAIVDLTEKPLPMAPKYTASVGAQYARPLSSATDLRLGMQYEYRAEYLLANNPPALFREDSVQQLQLSIGVAASDERWSLLLRGRNLTGDVYKTNVFIADGTQWATLSDPETAELEFSARF